MCQRVDQMRSAAASPAASLATLAVVALVTAVVVSVTKQARVRSAIEAEAALISIDMAILPYVIDGVDDDSHRVEEMEQELGVLVAADAVAPRVSQLRRGGSLGVSTRARGRANLYIRGGQCEGLMPTSKSAS